MFEKLTFTPGINSQKTPTLNEGGWSASNLIRFRAGLPEVLGGWLQVLLTPLLGAIRGLHAWAVLAGTATLGAGTNLKLYVIQGGQSFDVTPITRTVTPTSPYTTVNLSSIVTVHDVAHGRGVGDFVEISGGAAVNGITVGPGEFVILSVVDLDHYTISVAPQVANASGSGGGTPTLAYLLIISSASATSGAGWGAGAWGDGTWGTPRTGGFAAPGFPRMWELDNWGENMVANPRGFGIYQWVAATGTTVRAAVLANAPTNANGILVAAPLQMLVAWGANPPAGGAQDPMLMAWSDVGDNTVWTPLITNQAGSFRLTNGSQIMQALTAQQQILIWTDTTLYGMQYIQPPLVWSFNQLASSCGAISPKAAGILGGSAYWMSGYEFWAYTGEAHVIDCPLRDAVFKNLNRSQQSKIVCSINTEWSEVTWFYPSASSLENDSYITLNIDELSRSGAANAWYGGLLSRTAWIDDSVFGTPIGADSAGNIWSHEIANTNNGAFMPFSIDSGYVDLAEGEDLQFLDLLIPDQILSAGGQVSYTFFSVKYPGDVPRQYGPFTVGQATKFIPLRIRARQIKVRIDNGLMAVNVFWRHGKPRARVAPDGRQ